MAAVPRLFVYRIVTEVGAAPHISNEHLTLTICKPGIRKSAKAGDYVLALVALQHGKIVGKAEDRYYKAAYLFQVGDVIPMTAYEGWCKEHAPNKITNNEHFEGNCQYDANLTWRPGPHGPHERERNIKGCNSLVSTNYAAWTSAKPYTIRPEEAAAIGLDPEQVRTATRNFFTVPLDAGRVAALEELIGKKPGQIVGAGRRPHQTRKNRKTSK
jgi:hypothetical protein